MSINQINPDLNDAFELYFPIMGKVKRAALGVVTRTLSKCINIRRNLFGAQILLNERIVEYPLITRWLTSDKKARILDIGCWSSRLPIQLASIGYEVHGLDVQDYPFTHPNFLFHSADLFSWKPNIKFDAVISISVIEHFGIGGYGDKIVDDGDIKAVEKMSSLLKKGGHLLISVPFGKGAITEKHRIYDCARLDRVFKGFDRTNEAYFLRNGKDWTPCSAESLATVESPCMPVNGVAILDLRLK